jgi:hypothetical protein
MMYKNRVHIHSHMKISIVFSGHLRDICENPKLSILTSSFLHACNSQFDACDIFIHTWMSIDKMSNKSSSTCLETLSNMLSPKGIIREHQIITSNKTFGWANESLQGIRMNIAGMYGGFQIMNHYAALFGPYNITLRLRTDMFGNRMQNRLDYRKQFPDAQEWELLKRRHNSNHLFECHRPRAKRIDFCFYGQPERMTHMIEHTFFHFDMVQQKCAKMMSQVNWPLFSESLLACSMIDTNMSIRYIG